MTSKIVSTVQSLKDDITNATATAMQGIKELRASIADTRRQLVRAESLPLPRPEILARAKALVERTGADYRRNEALNFIVGIHGLGNPFLEGDPVVPWSWLDPMPWGAVCASQPKQAFEILAHFINCAEFETGEPLSDRPALIASLKHDLAELETDEERLIDQVVAAGLRVTHRPEVQQRREIEARDKRRSEAVAEASRANDRPPVSQPGPGLVQDAEYWNRQRASGQLSSF